MTDEVPFEAGTHDDDGARRTTRQPGIEESSNWRVYLDPVGHPFCLCWD